MGEVDEDDAAGLIEYEVHDLTLEPANLVDPDRNRDLVHHRIQGRRQP